MNKCRKERNTGEQHSYKYSEIICGYCKHRFVFNKTLCEFLDSHYWKSDGTRGYRTKCPKCEEYIVSFDDEIEALPFVLREDKDDIRHIEEY